MNREASYSDNLLLILEVHEATYRMQHYTVKPPNNGHIGTTNFVRCTEGTKVTCIFNELARTVISLLVML